MIWKEETAKSVVRKLVFFRYFIWKYNFWIIQTWQNMANLVQLHRKYINTVSTVKKNSIRRHHPYSIISTVAYGRVHSLSIHFKMCIHNLQEATSIFNIRAIIFHLHTTILSVRQFKWLTFTNSMNLNQAVIQDDMLFRYFQAELKKCP